MLDGALFAGCAILAAYSTLCIWMPRIRPRWKRDWWSVESEREGLVSSIGFAVFSWNLVLLPTGLLPDRLSFALFLLGVALWMIGHHLPPANR